MSNITEYAEKKHAAEVAEGERVRQKSETDLQSLVRSVCEQFLADELGPDALKTVKLGPIGSVRRRRQGVMTYEHVTVRLLSQEHGHDLGIALRWERENLLGKEDGNVYFLRFPRFFAFELPPVAAARKISEALTVMP